MTIERLYALKAAGDPDDVTQHRRLGRRAPRRVPRGPRHLRPDRPGRRLGATSVGLPLQINTLVTDETLSDLPATYELMQRLGIIRWSLFFLISVGRGTSLREIGPADSERLNHWLYEISKTSPFAIKTTEATHYRRVAIRRMHEEGLDDAAIAATSVGRGFGVRDGNGIMFISHDGNVLSVRVPAPRRRATSGRTTSWSCTGATRSSPACATSAPTRAAAAAASTPKVCGGSRARAYAWTGDVLETDPLCPYVPPVADRRRPAVLSRQPRCPSSSSVEASPA